MRMLSTKKEQGWFKSDALLSTKKVRTGSMHQAT